VPPAGSSGSRSQLVGAGADDLLVGEQLVGREDLGIDDGPGRGAQDEREGLIVRCGECEYDRGVIGGLDRGHVAQQRRRTARVIDGEYPFEGELDILGGQRIAVGELQAGLHRAGVVLAAVGEVALAGGVRCRRGLARRDDEKELVQLRLQHQRAVVVRAGRVEADHLVGGADLDGATRRGRPGRGGCTSGDRRGTHRSSTGSGGHRAGSGGYRA